MSHTKTVNHARTQRQRPGDSRRGEQVLVALRRIIRAIDLHSKQLARQTGLTVPQLVLLQAIRDMGKGTTRELSGRVSLSQATVTTILTRLEARQFIERYRSDIDRRIVHTRLTAKARRILRKAPPLLHERFSEAFAQLKQTEQHRIIETLEQIANMMGAGELDAAPLLEVGSALGSETGEGEITS